MKGVDADENHGAYVQRSRLIGAITLTFSRQALGTVLQLSITMVLARWLGAAGFGHYTLAVLLPVLLANLFNLGFPSANAYFIPREPGQTHVALWSNLFMWISLSAVGSCAAAQFVHGLAADLFPHIPATLLWVGIASFPVVLYNMFANSVLQGREAFRAYNLAQLAPPLLQILLVGVFVLGLGGGTGAALWCWMAAQVSGAVVGTVLLAADFCPMGRASAIVAYSKRSILYGLRAYVSIVMSFLNYRLDFLIVNFLVGPAALGVYSLASQIAEKLWLISSSASSVLLPRLAGANARGARASQLTTAVAQWTVPLGVLGASALVSLALLLRMTVLGASFAGIVGPLVVLLPGVVLYNVARVLGNEFAAAGRLELNTITAGISLCATVGANFLLVPHFGVLGAAIASSVAYMATTISTVLIFGRLRAVRWWVPFFPSRQAFRDLFQVLSAKHSRAAGRASRPR